MADNKHIVVAGFWDKSFRIYSVENAKLEQGTYFSYFDAVYIAWRARESYLELDHCANLS